MWKVPGTVMIYFKSCKRCSGDLSMEHDYYGWYLICLSCSNVVYPKVGEEKQNPAVVSTAIRWQRAEPQQNAINR